MNSAQPPTFLCITAASGCLAATIGFGKPSLGWVSSKARTTSHYPLCPNESQAQEGAQEKCAEGDELGIQMFQRGLGDPKSCHLK